MFIGLLAGLGFASQFFLQKNLPPPVAIISSEGYPNCIYRDGNDWPCRHVYCQLLRNAAK